MDQSQTFQRFLTTQSIQIPILGFVLNLLLAALSSYLLGRIYIKHATSLSNRRTFSNNFVLVTMTTMVIITIVKSSLALSLGLVGALSIVRFRAAIKEPEELAYLFLTIAIGLGFGADQGVTTVIAFVVICGVIILRRHYQRTEDHQNLYLTITSDGPRKVTLERIVKLLRKHCSAVEMKRFDETGEILEVTFVIELDDFEQLQTAKSELRKLNDSMKITFMDNRGVC